MQELADAQCGLFQRARMRHGECVSVFTRALAGDTKIDRAIQTIGRCIEHHAECDAVMHCVVRDHVQEPDDLRACHDASDGRKVALPAAEYEARVGATATHFSQLSTSRERPAEACGIVASKKWLTTLRCDDQSLPVTDIKVASELRVGNVGVGGRCGSIVDLYRIPCPEQMYELYVDAYMCPAP